MTSVESISMRLETEAIGFSRRLRGFAWRRLGDWDAAEDASQEAFRRVLKALHAGQIRSEETLIGFMLETARHVCCHSIRSAQRERRALQRLDRRAVDRSYEDVETRLSLAKELTAMRIAIQHLDGSERELLRLRYHDGLPIDDIAARVRLHPATLRVHTYRLLRRLRTSIREILKRRGTTGHLSFAHDSQGGSR